MTVTTFKVWWHFREHKGICAGSIYNPDFFENRETDEQVLDTHWFYIFEGNMSDDYNRRSEMTNLAHPAFDDKHWPKGPLDELLFERLELYRDGRLIGVACDSGLLSDDHDMNKVPELYKDTEVVYLDSYRDVISEAMSESG
ncbi:MAG TPA: hypothetical protein VMV86_01275 [Methanosarcinales archaeon]|nr:hypothetical protein [Methanosarcinales archaeon]